MMNLLLQVVNGVKFDGPVVDGTLGAEDGGLLIETCITRTLPPALTLKCGLDSIKQAVESLKAHPPNSTSGILRFQVQPFDASFCHCFALRPRESLFTLRSNVM